MIFFQNLLHIFSFVPLFDNGNCLGFNNILHNNEYKTFHKNFNDLVTDLRFVPDINEFTIINLLQEVYENFNIEEIAKNEIIDSHKAILNIKHNYYTTSLIETERE